MKARSIEVLLFDGVNLLDVSGPVQAFEAATLTGRARYEVVFVSLDGAPVRASCGLMLTPVDALKANSDADDLLIPGGVGIDEIAKDSSLQTILQGRAAQSGDGRLISICSGALALAAAGVLDGRSATTHWSRCEDIDRFPAVNWDLDRINVSDARVFTSAGVTTGIDLALDIIRQDCGPTTALSVARELVVQLRRTGGQSQYAMHLAGQFTRDNTLSRLIEKVVSQPEKVWTLDTLADESGLNSRTLSRHFKRDLQQTPAQFVEYIRVDHARGLLEDNLPQKQVAAESGFGDVQRMRRAFQRRFGIHVSDYLKAFAG
ncbi:MAG: DJ-1/PfpI family protein [Thalassovita sp.]